ncbi:MAG: hypothetical protein HRU25_12910 [Psychrobium sp.]|nr:hypothetical protein [Psychrobium sp.]
MTIDQELEAFYRRVGFGEVLGDRPCTVPVYTGCLLVPLPNIETRYKYLKYHDMHHLMTDYSVGRIGEGEVSAWELGTGSFFKSPLLGVMNLIALSTGLVLKPQRMWNAFVRGCNSKNLYGLSVRRAVDDNKWKNIEEIKTDFLEIKERKTIAKVRLIEFLMYSSIAMLIHASIAIPALILRFGTDLILKKSIIQAIKPVKRDDLF